MCAITHRAKSYQHALFIKMSLDDVIGPQQSACEAILQYQNKILISPLTICLQKVLLKHLKKCAFYMIYKLKLPLRVSLRIDTSGRGMNCGVLCY